MALHSKRSNEVAYLDSRATGHFFGGEVVIDVVVLVKHVLVVVDDDFVVVIGLFVIVLFVLVLVLGFVVLLIHVLVDVDRIGLITLVFIVGGVINVHLVWECCRFWI